MNLAELRDHFRSLSGRYDLVDDDPSNTVNFLINEACRYLDRLTQHQKSFASYFNTLAADAFAFSIPFCRSIKEVWVTDSLLNRWQLEKKDLQDLLTGYMASPPDSGTVLFYSPVITRKIPEDADLSAFASYMTYLDTQTNLTSDYNAILLLPPPSNEVFIEVRGYFYSKTLVEDSDVNYWSVTHPITLLKSVMRELEVFNQNQTKVEGWDKALAIEIDQINKDLVSEIVAEVNEMEGKSEDDIA